MMISGAQSALAGVVFSIQAFHAAPGIAQLAPYAAFGGVYFLLSGLWLTFRKNRALPAQ
jgi:drug/metabolite transporter superfamily protein YnfA